MKTAKTNQWFLSCLRQNIATSLDKPRKVILLSASCKKRQHRRYVTFFIIFLSLSYSYTRRFGPRQNKTLVRFVTDRLQKYVGYVHLLWTLTTRPFCRGQSVTNLISSSTYQWPGHTSPPCSRTDTHTCIHTTSSRWEHIFRTHRDCLCKLKKTDHRSFNHCISRIACEYLIPRFPRFGTNRKNIELQAPIFYKRFI